jgi:hypothetical protein
MKIKHHIEITIKGKEPFVLPQEIPKWVEELKGHVESLVGDGKAQISRSRQFGLATDFSRVKVSGHFGVTLTCNQDIETMKMAADLAGYIADTIVFEEDYETMTNVLRHYNVEQQAK